MRVLVYPHDLNMGGSQTNAIEIAAKIRDLGVESIIFGRPGVLNGRIDELGLEFIESPDPGRRPSIKIAALLRSLAREREIDVLHGYEWPPSLEAAAAAYGLRGTTAVSTVMSMAVAPFIPKTMPLVVGTAQIAAVERIAGRTNVGMIEPPVDLDHNVAPSETELTEFRERWGLRPQAMLVVCVSRLAHEMKSEGMLSAVAAMGNQLADLDLQFLIVGDGPARDEIRAAASDTNARTQPDRVIMTGELLDPRSPYALADVVLGMGGSALRALAFSKPLIVQGESGFFRLLTPATVSDFAWQGWYGIGNDPEQGRQCFTELVRELTDPDRRADLGRWGRELVTQRFSLEAAARAQYGAYREATTSIHHASPSVSSFMAAGVRFTSYYVRRKVAKAIGRQSVDDFNAKPATRPRLQRHPAQTADATNHSSSIIYLAGSSWDSVAGTDVELASALGRIRPVIWVDPPDSILSYARHRGKPSIVSEPLPGVVRVHPVGFPGVTRPLTRSASRHLAHAFVLAYLRRSNVRPAAVISSTPESVLADWRESAARLIYFATDDFVAGADLLRRSPGHLARSRERTLSAADLVLAVSEPLARDLQRPGLPVVEFPNGCDVARYAAIESVQPPKLDGLPPRRAGVVGQFNTRLDLDCLEAVADSDINLLLVGPCVIDDPRFARRFSRLVERPNVLWIDRQPPESLPPYLASLSVGLTPYTRTRFNDASFPLKTLEYLAAGLPVVSTDLPAARRLDTRFVRIAATPDEFAASTRRLLNGEEAAFARADYQKYASQFSWAGRAEELDRLIRSDLSRGLGTSTREGQLIGIAN